MRARSGEPGVLHVVSRACRGSTRGSTTHGGQFDERRRPGLLRRGRDVRAPSVRRRRCVARPTARRPRVCRTRGSVSTRPIRNRPHSSRSAPRSPISKATRSTSRACPGEATLPNGSAVLSTMTAGSRPAITVTPKSPSRFRSSRWPSSCSHRASPCCRRATSSRSRRARVRLARASLHPSPTSSRRCKRAARSSRPSPSPRRSTSSSPSSSYRSNPKRTPPQPSSIKSRCPRTCRRPAARSARAARARARARSRRAG